MRRFARFSTIYTVKKKHEKNPLRSATFSKVKPATLLKVTLLHGCFSRFLNRVNGTKSQKASQISCDSKSCCSQKFFRVLTEVYQHISSVIRRKGKSQNGCFKKTKQAKFSKKLTFLTS